MHYVFNSFLSTGTFRHIYALFDAVLFPASNMNPAGIKCGLVTYSRSSDVSYMLYIIAIVHLKLVNLFASYAARYTTGY